MGSHSPGYNDEFWGLEFDANGDHLLFSSEGGGQQYIYADAPVSLSSNSWYQIVLTYNTNSSTLYTNGQAAVTGGGVREYPGLAAREALGFNVGSDSTGGEQAFGLFDDLETFNYPMSASDVNLGYQQYLSNPTFQFPAMFISSNIIDLNFQGVPAVTVAVLVNDANYGDAVGQTYYPDPDTGTIQVPVNLGSSDGVYFVYVGVWNGSAFNWASRKIVVDTMPPQIVPAGYSVTTNFPLLQLTGYATESR